MIIAASSTQLSASKPTADAQDIFHHSQTHCMLLQRAPKTPQPRYLQRLRDAQADDLQFSLAKQYEYAPDFGFLIPHFWPTMSWVQRVRFNHTLAAYVKRQLNIPPRSTAQEDCVPDVRIVETPDEIRKTSAYTAIAVMNLRADDNILLPLSYYYEKPIDEPWKLEDIIIYNNSLKEKNRGVLNEVIRTEGLDKLEAHLETLVKTP